MLLNLIKYITVDEQRSRRRCLGWVRPKRNYHHRAQRIALSTQTERKRIFTLKIRIGRTREKIQASPRRKKYSWYGFQSKAWGSSQDHLSAKSRNWCLQIWVQIKKSSIVGFWGWRSNIEEPTWSKEHINLKTKKWREYYTWWSWENDGIKN